MKINNICNFYFNAFSKIEHGNYNERALAALSIISYFTLIIPLCFAVAYQLSSLIGKIKKKEQKTTLDIRVENQAKKVLITNNELGSLHESQRHNNWWSKINSSPTMVNFENDWHKLRDKKIIQKEASNIRMRYNALSTQFNDDFKLAGDVYNIPNNFSMWMSGVAFIASYLCEKKNLNNLYVCESLEGFCSKLHEISTGNIDQKCAFVIPIISSSMSLKPNYPQHKIMVGVEKKGNNLTVILLDSMPQPINPKNITDNIWSPNFFSGQELAYRAILKGCKNTNPILRLMYFDTQRETKYGCETFALQDATTFLQDRNFFDRIAKSDQKIKINDKIQIETILRLPPEYMKGTQSYTVMDAYRDKVGQAIMNQPLKGKQKSLNECLKKYSLKVDAKEQNHYITKKSYKYLNFLVESLNYLKANEIKNIIAKTLI